MITRSGGILDINVFLTDANTLMQQVAELAATTLTVGTAMGHIIDRGKQLITVLISPFRRQSPQPEEPMPPTPLSGDVAPITGPITTKAEVAILVDINRRMLIDVGRYLQQQGIDADLIIVTNDPTYGDKVKFLDVTQPQEWEEIAREFNSAMGKIKRAVGGARVHLFLATPLPLALALGALMGTVDENTTVYHWENGTYWPVMTLSRKLRQ